MSAEGLIATAESLNLRIYNEEQRLEENEAIVAEEQAQLDETAHRLKEVEETTLNTITKCEEASKTLHKWSTTVAIHPAVNNCKKHFLTEDFLQESVVVLNVLLKTFQFLQDTWGGEGGGHRFRSLSA